MSQTLVLIRHGEPIGHAGRCIGHFDTELAPSAGKPLERLAASVCTGYALDQSVSDGLNGGRLQTSHAANAGVPQLIVSSDLRRAANSAAVLARHWRAEPRFDPRMRELSFGDWDGLSWDEIARADGVALEAWGRDWMHCAPTGGETGIALAARVHAALDGVLAVIAGQSCDVAIVSHAGWIRVATTLLCNEPLGAAFDRTIDYARAAVFRVDAGSTVLRHWNVDSLAGNISSASATIKSADAPRPAPSSIPP
jgi:broad specificity phosphatase PhoE